MIARFEIGEVLLATSIKGVLRQLLVAVVPRDSALPNQLAEEHSTHLRQFGGLAERKRSLTVEGNRKLDSETLRNFSLGNAKSLDYGIRDI